MKNKKGKGEEKEQGLWFCEYEQSTKAVSSEENVECVSVKHTEDVSQTKSICFSLESLLDHQQHSIQHSHGLVVGFFVAVVNFTSVYNSFFVWHDFHFGLWYFLLVCFLQALVMNVSGRYSSKFLNCWFPLSCFKPGCGLVCYCIFCCGLTTADWKPREMILSKVCFRFMVVFDCKLRKPVK